MDDIQACMRCGSQELHPLTISDGMWAGAGETLKWVCGACQWQGAPLLFDTKEAYEAFRSSLDADTPE